MYLKSTILLLFIFLTSCASTSNPIREPAEFSGFSSCLNIVSSFFKSVDSKNNFGLEELIVGIDPDVLPKIAAIHNRSDLLYYSIVSQDPATLKLLEAFPSDKNAQRLWIKELSTKFKNYHETSLSDYVNFLERKSIINDFFPSLFLNKQKIEFAALEKGAKLAISEQVEQLSESQILRQFYSKNFYANVTHDEDYLFIGEEKFKYTVKGDEIVLSVPRTKVKSPAWNPLTKEQTNKVINSNASPPSVYDTVLGLDGAFYLFDGNHRFHLKETKEIVKVKISGFKTSTLRVFLDLVGAQQFTQEEIKLLKNQEKTVRELLPEAIFKKLIWPDDELVRDL